MQQGCAQSEGVWWSALDMGSTAHTTVFHVGKVSERWPVWAGVTDNRCVLFMVKGISTELLGLPLQLAMPTSEWKGNDPDLKVKILEMLDQGIIDVVQPVSHLFLQWKQEGDFRPILNLFRLSEFVVYQHFKMEQLTDVSHLINRGAWLASIDIYISGLSQPVGYVRYSVHGTLARQLVT